MSEAPTKAPQPDAPDAKAEISRRDVFAKIGMALNGLAVVVLATPVVGYLLLAVCCAPNAASISAGSRLVISMNFPKARPGWRSFVIRSPMPGTAIPTRFPAGCAA